MNKDRKGVFESAIENFLGPILPFLKDNQISEILINSASEIFVEKAGKLYRTKAQFEDEDSLRAAVNNIAQSVGRRIDYDHPRLDARLPDGSRIAAVIPPCARKGTAVSIRKFTNNDISFKDYIQSEAITQDVAQFLDICMFLGKNILLSGGTGSGKTTLLGLLCSRIPKGQRVIVIEDSSELSINYDHILMFETRMADQSGKGEVSIRDLLVSSLRLRPDRIIVGEVRGGEALELINAMNTGHKGCMGTIHSNSPNDSLVRLEALAQGGFSNISEKALKLQISSAIDLVVQISRLSDGSRRVTGVEEVLNLNSDGTYQLNPLFRLSRLQRSNDGKLAGRLCAVGHLPSFIEEIEDNRLPFGRNKFSVSD